jgi:Arc/MetJ-type ribon-helix-helix transcriptional regulator
MAMTAKAHQIELTIEQQKLMDRHLESGNYDTPSDVIGDALVALEERDAAHDRLLRAQVKAALASDEPSVPIDEAFARARAAIAHAAKAKSHGT